MRRWPIDAAPAGAEIEEIAASIRAGDIILLPTDTIYGLHALAGDARAIERLADAKGRRETKPFVVIAATVEQLEEIGIDVRPEVLASLWPAPLTAILPLARPIAASRGEATIAVRIPDLAWLRELLTRTGPLASTSANRAGEPPISTPDQLSSDVITKVDGVVDAGPRDGKPSTIVDFTGDEPRLIREGDPAFAQKVWKTLRKTL
jgi:tRNA threonylcarbamoyl adenosine modification protein (Sua5/YciO/YrdC/YwlC family)